MVVDIGGGTTEVAVISLGGIVTSQSVRIGGDELDEAIISFVKKEYSLALGERTAEEIKIALGSAYPLEEELHAEIRGRDLVTGLPKTVVISTEEIRKAIDEPVSAIVDAVKVTLDRTPPELAADIMEQGIVLTGGGALLHGLDARLAARDRHADRGRRRPAATAWPSAAGSASRSSRPSSGCSSPPRLAERPAGASSRWRSRGARAAPRPRSWSWSGLGDASSPSTSRAAPTSLTSGLKSVAADVFAPVRTGVDDILSRRSGTSSPAPSTTASVREREPEAPARDRPAAASRRRTAPTGAPAAQARTAARDRPAALLGPAADRHRADHRDEPLELRRLDHHRQGPHGRG